MESAEKALKESQLVYETPILSDVGHLFNLPSNISLYLKLETMQTNGSFKIRGVYNQFKNANLEKLDQSNLKLVTFSAGNYGKAFAFLCNKLNYKGKVLLPESAAESRINYIKVKQIFKNIHFKTFTIYFFFKLVARSRSRKVPRSETFRCC